ncbi:MAG TPA: response regulator, partial [Myxococcota bacterium]
MSAEQLPILIVDDEAAVARALERLLTGRGFLTRVENSPAAAIDAVREETFGAVISDMNFSPERTDGDEGTALFKAIRELDPELPVVLMTAWASLERAVSLVREGAADYVEKPWDPDKLLPTLKNLIDLRATRLENRRLRGERE